MTLLVAWKRSRYVSGISANAPNDRRSLTKRMGIGLSYKPTSQLEGRPCKSA